jgi:hypothetical protein
MKSRVNEMVFVDFQSGVKMAGINTDYVLDATSSEHIDAVAEELSKNVGVYADIFIQTQSDTDDTSIYRLFSNEKVTGWLYYLILASFFLSSVVVTSLWLKKQTQAISVRMLCGYSQLQIALVTGISYLFTSLAGFVISVFAMIILQTLQNVVTVTLQDITLSFLLTIGLGILVLAGPLAGTLHSQVHKHVILFPDKKTE